MGGIGVFAEPLAVVVLLFGGAWINRDFNPGLRRRPGGERRISEDDLEDGGDWKGADSRSSSPSLLPNQEPEYRRRTLKAFGLQRQVTTPNTRRFKGYFLSQLFQKFPFLVECWYWLLTYWVFQFGRAATAVWTVESTIHRAEEHALEVIAVEQRLHIFWELPIQQFLMRNQFMMSWINRVYSFIQIPGSIAFLVWLFYYTNTSNRIDASKGKAAEGAKGSPGGPRLYEARRRTMVFCNLLAFIVFTFWPCMPPRLLSADDSDTPTGRLARSYGFADTVHGPGGEGSIWTDNRFTNKFTAMPSLHFGYALLIGLTIATIPLNPAHSSTTSMMLPFFNQSHPKLAPKIKIPSWRRLSWIALGIFYPSLILLVSIATANHFILDAIAGSFVCGIAWWGNEILLNLLALEDWFLWAVRIHKPESVVSNVDVRDNGQYTPLK